MDAPQNYKTAGTMMLVAGILNLMVGVVVAGASLFVFAPCCCVGLLPLGFGVFELVTGLSVMNGQPVKYAPVVSMVGIVVGALGLLGGGVIPLVLEILATIAFQDQAVKGWLEANAT